mmetsp:Transcript_9059/g.37362  ORF Transcript_9059/g.37362 Transcript_9059/m.37362 type:complete len:611 (+) Transcript_9059:51-1883(+)
MGSVSTEQLEVSSGSEVSFLTLPKHVSGGELRLHAQWIRERCGCPACAEPVSRQPYVSISTPGISPKSLRLANAELSGDLLLCRFADSHEVRLSVGRVLEEHASFRSTGALIAPQASAIPSREPWTAATFSLPLFEHEGLELHRDNPSDAARRQRRALLGSLLKTGVAVVRGVPCFKGEVLRFSRALVGQVRETHWGVVFDVKSSAAARDTEGNADQAFSSDGIAFHADNTYRRPMIDYQLLHCIQWLGRDERPDDGVNRFVDAFACAERLRATDKASFEILCSTPVKWESDAPMVSCEPLIQLSNDGGISRVFFSAKSGGFAPILPSVEEQERYYTAQRKLVALFESDEFVIRHRLSPGELVIFANTRVLHARTGFSQQMTRHLQGMYIDHDAVYRTYQQLAAPAPAAGKAAWTSLMECPAEDVELMGRLYAEDQVNNRVQRVLGMLNAQRGLHTKLGATVDLYQHGLQTATRAHRAGESVDVVVGALLHDIGELYSPSNHGDIAAAMLAPYIEPAVHWCLAHHEIFQMQFYGKQMGLDTTMFEQYEDHEHFAFTQRFCELYDQTAFDAHYDYLPLSFFTPMVEEVFSRTAYWHTPDHPKRGLVTGRPE